MLHVVYNAMLLREPYSGVEYAILDLMEALYLHGQHRYTFCIPESVPLPDSLANAETHHVSTQRIKLPLASRALRMLWEQIYLPKITRDLRADIIHAPGYLAPLRTQHPVVLTVYDIEAIFSPRFCRFLNRMNYAFFLPRSIKKAKSIITPSLATKQHVAARFPECGPRIRSIPLAIHDTFFQPITESKFQGIARRYGLPTTYILFVGNQEPRKNIPALLQVIETLRHSTHPGLTLVMAGAEGRSSRKKRKEILQLGATGALVTTGYIERPHLPYLYHGAKALLFPSWDEGFGLPPLEAMAAGCPVACSTAGALSESSPFAATFDPHNIDAIADQLRRVLDDQPYRTELIEAGRKHAAKFRWHSVACEMERLYEHVVEQPTPTPDSCS